jgi:hypothetical protein
MDQTISKQLYFTLEQYIQVFIQKYLPHKWAKFTTAGIQFKIIRPAQKQENMRHKQNSPRNDNMTKLLEKDIKSNQVDFRVQSIITGKESHSTTITGHFTKTP